MRIELRLFASLRKLLPPGSPRGHCTLDLPEGTTLGDMLAHVRVARASAQMILVNGEHDRNFRRALSDGDVVSVFPPVAGGQGDRGLGCQGVGGWRLAATGDPLARLFSP